MSKRTKIFFITAAVVLLLVILIVFRFVNAPSSSRPLASSGQSGNSAVPLGSSTTLGSTNGITSIVSPDGATNIEAIARSFTERFGSFSNQGDFENVEDLYPFMTAKMRQWAEGYVTAGRARQEAVAADYFGTTTRALGSQVIGKGSQKMVVLVTAQRRESTTTALNARVYNQDIELVFVENAGIWRVDDARWK